MGIFNFFNHPATDHQWPLWRLDRKTYLCKSADLLPSSLAGFCMICAAVSVLFVYDDGAIRIRQEKQDQHITG